MIKKESKNVSRIKRHARIRKNLSGTSETPRLNVFRSNTNIYAQIIDDVKGVTLVSASSLNMKLKKNDIEAATKVGTEVAEKAIKAGIKEVVFDRGGYAYHGRVKALADAAREAGLKF
ncbi:MAG: 50S ribosomal protein L18 [Bacilli bacterium]|nr:50S ribosomal protein L18 [Bacilli bacterium]